MPTQAAPPAGWSGDNNLGFLLEVNGYNAASPDVIVLDVTDPIDINVTILTETNLTIHEAKFQMSYMSIPIINPPAFDLSSYGVLPDGFSGSLAIPPIDLSPLFTYANITLVSGTVTGFFSFTYSNTTHPGVNATVSEDFILQIGPTGLGMLFSVTGLITAGFAVMSVFTLILGENRRRAEKQSIKKSSLDESVRLQIVHGMESDVHNVVRSGSQTLKTVESAELILRVQSNTSPITLLIMLPKY
jgi:hypothetical protein